MPLVGDVKRNYEAERSQAEYRTTRDVVVYAQKNELSWQPKDEKRRADCTADLELALRTYWPEAFPRAFSADHKELIAVCQSVLENSGCNVTAMPRGSGKTTIKTRALMWAALTGKRRFPVLGTADDGQFCCLMRGIKVMLETNQRLLEDFPEVIIPIRQLERVATKCVYQLYKGDPTYIRWSDQFVQFPFTELSVERGNAGVVISGGGITSALRGMVYTLPNGDQIRPDAILCDDIQTRKSAKSPTQVQERLDIIKGDLMGMRGDRPLAMMVTCTPIYEEDLAERLLSNEHSPEFKSIRVPMLKTMPVNMDLWEEYDVARRQELVGEAEPGHANSFYKANRKKLDQGAEHYWAEKVDDGKLSAIQCAMEDYLADPDMFAAEKQCQPQPHQKSDIEPLMASKLCGRVSPYPQGTVQADHSVLTAHIDVQAKVLYYAVCSWSQKFGGTVIEYNTWPKRPQMGRYFTLNGLRTGLASKYKGLDEGGCIRAGIKDCVQYLTTKQYKRENEGELGLNLILVDGRWRTDDVESGIIESKSPIAQIMFGTGIGAVHAAMSQWNKKPGRVFGDHWVEDKPARRKRRAIHADVNHWKSELHTSLSVPDLHQEALRWYNGSRTYHQLISDHCVAEVCFRVEARNRTVDEWQLKHSTHDNHFWDNLVGCMVGASKLGLKRSRHEYSDVPKKRIKLRTRQATAW